MRTLAMVLLSAAIACSRTPASEERARGGPMPIAVDVVELVPQTVEYAVPAVGSVEAFESIQITARVAGVVERVHFKEGDTVEKSAMLVEIEPQRYELAHAAAKATLDRALAARAEAERELTRAQKLLAEGISTEADVGNWQTKLATASANEAEARAALGVAALNLKEARLRAPIEGVMQSRNVQTGQYVQPGTVLATLLRRDPLLLRFRVVANEATRVKPGMLARFKVKDDPRQYAGKITFVAESADPTSRMVSVVAEIIGTQAAGGEGKEAEGPAASLRPGSFAEVSVPVESVENAIVAPQSAVRPSERGFLAYVVDGDAAKERVLSLGMRTADGLVEIKQGLKAGERVVVRGAEALRDGAKVKTAPATTPPIGSAGVRSIDGKSDPTGSLGQAGKAEGQKPL